MRPVAEGVSQPRCALFETLEDRLVLSAASLADFFAHRSEAPVEEPQHEITTLGDSLTQGGVTASRTSYGFTGAGQTVAVIDTGIAYDQYALGHGYGAGHRVVGGWDFAENDANPYDDGPAGFHGTHVAGIIGSSDSLYSGVAPGADLVALRVFDDQGNSNFAWVESALKWVHQHRNDFANPITTVNLSLGTSWNANTVPNWATLEEEFAQLKTDGIFISVAAGNSFSTYKTPGLSYPAASPYVVPVASVGDTGLLSGFSQRNMRVIAAPGEHIMSTVPDWLFGGNGVPNDFMQASGTSMASPYVAGASVLLRQAMQFAGYQNITEDTLYNTMYNTADLVYDSATSASYHRLNLQRAIDSVMPADDFGSTASAASSLGTIGGDKNFNGIIGRLDDKDFFQFTASQSGTMQLTASASGGLVTQWMTPTGTTASGGTFSFNVVAGQTYTFGLGTSGGIGRYTVAAHLQTNAATTTTDWGTIDFRQVAGQSFTSGDAWFRVTAARTGTFTAEAMFAQAGGNVDIELCDANQQALAAGAASGSGERVDATVTAGQSYYLHVHGVNSSVAFRLTNLVSENGNQVNVFGTSGNDTVTFVAGTNPTISVNGVTYQFAADKTVFKFQGGGGVDSLAMTGTAAKEDAILRVGNVQYSGVSFQAQASGFENVTVTSGGGGDTARLYDSLGDDQFAASPTSATLNGTGFSNTASGFASVRAYSSSGNDTAQFFDSAGADRFVGYSGYSYLCGDGFYNYAAGFKTVTATSSGGADRAELYGTDGNDSLLRTHTQASLSGAGYVNTAVGFGTLRAFGGGGADEAVFREIGSGDYFYGRTTTARLTGSGLDQQAYEFETVTAAAATGQSPRADVQAVDYIFNRVGQWQP